MKPLDPGTVVMGNDRNCLWKTSDITDNRFVCELAEEGEPLLLLGNAEYGYVRVMTVRGEIGFVDPSLLHEPGEE